MSALPLTATSGRSSISIAEFENGSIDPEQFDHEAHVFIAWSYQQKYDLEDAIAKFSEALRSLTRKLGIESKYHETITWCFLSLIAESRNKPGSNDWQTFKRQNPDLLTARPSIIRKYYSDERLDSSIARSQFVLPDKLPQL